MAEKPQKKTQTIDEAAREAGFTLGATVQPGEIMLAGFAGEGPEAFAAAAEAANRGGIQAQQYRLMMASDGICITIKTQLPKEG